MHTVQVTRPDGSTAIVEVEAPNQRDAVNAAIMQVVGEDGLMINSSSISKTAAMHPDYKGDLK